MGYVFFCIGHHMIHDLVSRVYTFLLELFTYHAYIYASSLFVWIYLS